MYFILFQVNQEDNGGKVHTEMLVFRRKMEILDLIAEEFPALLESTKKAIVLWANLEDDQDQLQKRTDFIRTHKPPSTAAGES